MLVMNKKIENISNISSASLKKATGKSWTEWILILEKKSAKNWNHQETVHFLKTKYKLGPWWQQWITIGFEVYSGKRIEGRNLKGFYSLTVTKNINLEQKKLWKYITSNEGILFWLGPMSEFKILIGSNYEIEGGIYGELRSIKAPDRLRLSWIDIDWPKPSSIQILLVKRNPKKTMFVISQDNIPTAQAKQNLRSRWRNIVDNLESQIS